MNTIPYRHLSVLMIPTDFCNMNCVYCFNSRRLQKRQTMSKEILERSFASILPYYEEVRFIWHGGEPLSVGKVFYENVISLQRKYNINNADIKNSIQTNLTLLNDEMAQYLLENNFAFGSSFDGTQNHATRHNSEKIMDGYSVLQRHNGHCGFICVVQSHNIDHLIEDYEYFKSRHINYTINTYLSSSPQDDPLSVPADYYAKKVNELFDYWFFDSASELNISYFGYIVDYLLTKQRQLCCFNSCIGKHVGIYPNGDIYNCNRDFPKQYCFGNIMDYTDIHDCFNSPGFNRLLVDSIARRSICQESCELFDFCTGGCNSVAVAGGQVCKPNTYFCETLQPVYAHIEMRIREWSERDAEEICQRLCKPIADKLLHHR